MRSSISWVLGGVSLLTFAVGVLSVGTARAQYKAESNSILKVGEKIPLLSGTDQFGQDRDFENLKGPNGLVILFYRSADWCPYCKGQLLSLQRATPHFKEKGIGLVGVSYDTPEILKFFTERYSITYPLLADPKSEIIERFGVLNATAAGFTKGMSYPGYVYVSPDGRVQETFFEEDYHTRYTGNSVLTKIFPELATAAVKDVPAPHLQLKLTQTDEIVSPGNRVTLIAELSLPKDLHVYAPGVQGYKPVALELSALPQVILHAASYPQSKTLLLPAIGEKVPVFEGRFRVTQDITVTFDKDFSQAVASGPASGTPLTLSGNLRYQACDSKICYPPTSVPVSWQLTVMPLNTLRAPEEIRHK
ncbi:MAG TPA: redoxin domain-containing protein [Candidatus Acidoferrales bacterium]|nr:redoxin domain-containing protein [Candidatus Acidoferrales bacterium]